jgi:hypothetical protein
MRVLNFAFFGFEKQLWFCTFAVLVSVRCLSGRKEQFAKLSYWETGTEGSNPSLTARKYSSRFKVKGSRFKEVIIRPGLSLVKIKIQNLKFESKKASTLHPVKK